MGHARGVIPVIAAAILAAVISVKPGRAGEANCNIQKGPCTASLDSGRVVFDMTPKPVVPMKELTVTVRIEGIPDLPEELLASFDMPGMMMGKNETHLTKKNGNTYSGKGFLVKCPSGKTLWRVKISGIPRGQVEFLFNVSE